MSLSEKQKVWQTKVNIMTEKLRVIRAELHQIRTDDLNLARQINEAHEEYDWFTYAPDYTEMSAVICNLKQIIEDMEYMA